uniref:Uncharacterized protein n=1 Tax=Kalanchoe fedtschenkoi TaxID=63787 RepID=A0A7N0V8L6_KALFE
MSEEEMRIRDELGEEVERGVEDEIKEDMCKLALRLHHLYRQRNEQRRKQGADDKGDGFKNSKKKKKVCSELRINIRMLEGAAKIEFKEIKREVAPGKLPTGGSPAAAVSNARAKKFDWTQSLRSDGIEKKKKKKAFIC